MSTTCAHAIGADPVPVPRPPEGCAECIAIGGSWVHLRLCLACGHVGCCDNSPGMHATGHFQDQGHPLVRSYEPGEDWWWCYVDEMVVDVDGAPRARSHP